MAKAKARTGFFENLKKDAKKQREAFKASVAENQATALKVEYYARQTRMNRVYLDLFACVRREMPKDVTLNYFGPAVEGGVRPPAARRSEPGVATEDAARKFEMHGIYDPAAYPGAKFTEACEVLRQKILAVPGVVEAENEPLPDGGR